MLFQNEQKIVTIVMIFAATTILRINFNVNTSTLMSWARSVSIPGWDNIVVG